MGKITTLSEASKYSHDRQLSGKTVGLVVGSFDILHLGHTNLFKFAKKHVDYLIIGLDNDQTIKLVKGPNRPINNSINRLKFLAEINAVDKAFVIEETAHHDSEAALQSYAKLVKKILPSHIFTHKKCDQHWKNKKEIAKKFKIKFMSDPSHKITNSGTILKILLSEF